MKSIFKTGNNNDYLYHSANNEVQFIHPLVRFFSDLEDQGINTAEWLQQCRRQENPTVTIDGIADFSMEEIVYYYNKFRLLKEKSWFSAGHTTPNLSRRMTEQDIENLLNCSGEVLFETTKSCNLACRYCIQSDLYTIQEEDQRKDIDIEKAKRLLDYLSRHWLHSMSPRHIGIKFYGGEPLTNFEAVREIVEYTKTFTEFSGRFYYNITTNGVLLDRYLDYLTANSFLIAISLDGDEENNRHRIFKNGEPSFKKICANIDLLRKNHPEYFKTHVSFQSVLHNCNSISDVHYYFRKTYQKRPFMTELTRVSVNENRRGEFDALQRVTYDNLYHGEDYHLLKETNLNDLPTIPGSGIIGHKIYRWLLKSSKEGRHPGGSRTPTGTCHPFSKGVFMATDGNILPCERIPHSYTLGIVDEKGVHLDFKDIAERFNGYYDHMNQLCTACSNTAFCSKCLFYCSLEKPRPECNHYCNPKEFLTKLAQEITDLEDRPEIYFKHITELE